MSARKLRKDERGSIGIEFALLGPVLLVMLFGVLQLGMALQQYNALRNISADVARYAMVQYQSGNKLSNSQLRTYTLNRARAAPYMLSAARFNAAVNDAATQRVNGARELNIATTYQIDSLLEFAGIGGPFISYSRPVFLAQ